MVVVVVWVVVVVVCVDRVRHVCVWGGHKAQVSSRVVGGGS